MDKYCVGVVIILLVVLLLAEVSWHQMDDLRKSVNRIDNRVKGMAK